MYENCAANKIIRSAAGLFYAIDMLQFCDTPEESENCFNFHLIQLVTPASTLIQCSYLFAEISTLSISILISLKAENIDSLI